MPDACYIAHTIFATGSFRSGSRADNQPSSVRCRSAANPYRLAHECVGRTFDFEEETSTKDWVGLRTYLDELGIKPTVSYTTQPMGNPNGGHLRKHGWRSIPYLLGAGLNYEGLFHGRGSDIVSAGVISGILSRFIPQSTAETAIEINYQITFKHWFSITPDLQYVIRPGGRAAIGNAFLLGAQTTIVF